MVPKRKLRSSPRSNAYGEVTTTQLHGMGNAAYMQISCIEIDTSDGTTFYSTQTALFSSSASGTIALVAGHDEDTGFEDGSRSEARFRFLCAMALHKKEKCMYLCDYPNDALRRVELQTGETTTVGADNVAFLEPKGVAIDGNGVLYVTDQGRHCVHRVSFEGKDGCDIRSCHITTFVGGMQDGIFSGFSGYQDGPGEQALFSFPTGLTIDREDNLIVADYGNECIRKIKITDQALTVTTMAGSPNINEDDEWYLDGPAALSRFNGPSGVAVDCNNNIVVADCHNHVIRIIRTDGMVSTIAGSTDQIPHGDGLAEKQEIADGKGASVRFCHPASILFHTDGSLLVVERQNYLQVRRITYIHH